LVKLKRSMHPHACHWEDLLLCSLTSSAKQGRAVLSRPAQHRVLCLELPRRSYLHQELRRDGALPCLAPRVADADAEEQRAISRQHQPPVYEVAELQSLIGTQQDSTTLFLHCLFTAPMCFFRPVTTCSACQRRRQGGTKQGPSDAVSTSNRPLGS
jgi:hypothetical protein